MAAYQLTRVQTQTVLPNSDQPWQNQADGGMLKIQVSPTQVHDEIGHPVDLGLIM